MYKFSCRHSSTQLSVLLGRFLGSNLLGHGNSMFNLLRNCQIVFQSSCTIFIFIPTMYEGSNCFTSLPTLVIVYLHGSSNPSGCEKHISLWSLIYISPGPNDAKHIFKCLLAICVSSLEKQLWNSSPIFKCLRERAHMHRMWGRGRERERERERERKRECVPSRLRTVSPKPYIGLDLRNPGIMT